MAAGAGAAAGGPQFFLQGGFARGGLRGKDLPGATLLREQVQR